MLKDIQRWKDNPHLDETMKKELHQMDDASLHEAFYMDVAFGTGGIRAKMGAGTNRLNIYTIHKATLGLARYLKKSVKGKTPVTVISYDTRYNSQLFAKEAAKILVSYGGKVYVFANHRPTPELSYAVRQFHAQAGIMITASHNPPQYNGYKVYDGEGCQFVPAVADQIAAEMSAIESVFDQSMESFDTYVAKGKIHLIDDTFDARYIEMVQQVQCQKVPSKPLKIVFTPLHGTASTFGPDILASRGFDVFTVGAQMKADPEFSTVKSPNPEDGAAFKLAIQLGKEKGAHILLATDPDADRMGVAVKKGDEYILLTGNQTGALILDYLTKFKKRNKPGVMFSTIVTSDLGLLIAQSRGLDVVQTLTGFKFIGEQIQLLEGTGKEYFFGYEESYGCLLSPEVRDKDAFQALFILAEMASYYLQQGKSLLDALDDVYKEFGFFKESLININLDGSEGLKKIGQIMAFVKTTPIPSMGRFSVAAVEDYEDAIRTDIDGTKTPILLPTSQVVKFLLSGGGWVVFRPSGTEPKLKIYVSLKDTIESKVDQSIKEVETFIHQLLQQNKLL